MADAIEKYSSDDITILVTPIWYCSNPYLPTQGCLIGVADGHRHEYYDHDRDQEWTVDTVSREMGDILKKIIVTYALEKEIEKRASSVLPDMPDRSEGQSSYSLGSRS